MSKLTCIRLRKPVEGEELLHQAVTLKQLRLLSLQTDRIRFISRYEDEVDQPIEFALNRVRHAEAQHFVAVDASGKTTDEIEAQTFDRYEAFLVLINLGPEKEDEKINQYLMAAIYVRLEHRSKGVCTSLIQEALGWVNMDFRHRNFEKARIYIEPAENNVPAYRLYSKIGFCETERTTVKNQAGEDRDVIKMEMVLQ